MAAFGHSGSQTSQLMQSSVMIRDMLTPAGAAGPGAINQCAQLCRIGERSARGGDQGLSLAAIKNERIAAFGSSYFLKRRVSASATAGWTNLLISPPSAAISRTSVEEMNE